MIDREVSGVERRSLIAILGFLGFSVIYAQVVMAPVLTPVAAEFGITTGAAGLVVAGYGLPGLVLGFFLGPLSDRYGRKLFLVAGATVLGTFTILAAFAPAFPLLMVARAFAGAGASTIFPNVNATIGDSFSYRERGRAASAIIALNTVASVIGIPIAGIIAELLSWRISLGLTGFVVLIAAVILQLRLRADRPQGRSAPARALFGMILSRPSAVAAIIATFFGALFWMTWSTYIVVFLERTFALSAGVASTIALSSGVGLFAGTLIGGRIGDRVGHKMVAYRSALLAAVLLLVVTNIPLGLPASAALIFGLSIAIGMRFTTNSTLMTEQVPAARGTMLAMSSALQNGSLVLGATIGGVLVDGPGFGAFGVFCFVIATTGAAVMILFVREQTRDVDIEVAPA